MLERLDPFRQARLVLEVADRPAEGDLRLCAGQAAGLDPGDVESTQGGIVMRAVVVYESMFGNTRAIAEAIADGMRPFAEVAVVPVSEADESRLEGCDVV